jgi:hypothetical protein
MNRSKLSAALLAALFFGPGVLASEVYIEQAGSGVTVNITQTGAGHVVGKASGSTYPSVIEGNSINIDILQDGSNNVASIQLINGSDGTNIDYTSQGGDNLINIGVNGGTGNIIEVTKDGDDNTVNVCKTVLSGNCSAGIEVTDTDNTVNIAGSRNTVNMALASADSVNVINVGQTTISNDNTINLTQTNNAMNLVNVSIDGDNNTLTIVQQ